MLVFNQCAILRNIPLVIIPVLYPQLDRRSSCTFSPCIEILASGRKVKQLWNWFLNLYGWIIFWYCFGDLAKSSPKWTLLLSILLSKLLFSSLLISVHCRVRGKYGRKQRSTQELKALSHQRPWAWTFKI